MLQCYFNLDDEHKAAVGDYIKALASSLTETDSIDDIKTVLAVEKALKELTEDEDLSLALERIR